MGVVFSLVSLGLILIVGVDIEEQPVGLLADCSNSTNKCDVKSLCKRSYIVKVLPVGLHNLGAGGDHNVGNTIESEISDLHEYAILELLYSETQFATTVLDGSLPFVA